MAKNMISGRRIPFRVALIYAVIGAAWILASDLILATLVTDPEMFIRLQTYKGWFFIVVTAVALYIIIRRNVIEIERSQQSLQESEARYRTLVESIIDWVWEVDQHNVYTYSSPQVKDILGYEPEEVLGKTPFDFMPEDEAERIAKIFRGIETHRNVFKLLENTNLHKDGHEVVIETSGVPIFDSHGMYQGYRGIDRDITKRKQAEKALKEKDREIRQAYVDVFSAVTGDRLVIMTVEEVENAVGMPVSEIGLVQSYKDLSGARAALGRILEAQVADEEIRNELLLAASEALTNATKHAGGGNYQVFRKDDSVQVLVSDSGPGIDFRILPRATLLSGFSTKQSLGVGFSVMLELCDRVLLATQPGTTIIVLEKNVHGITEDMLDELLARHDIRPV